jgi:2-keto-4-pentenoate hydratase/2-oxohepta-3-ene-1,7-dioic acid hydratase in catechol pathway
MTSRLHIARYRVGVSVLMGRRVSGGFVRWSAPPWEGGVETGPADPLEGATLLPPVAPTKVVCVGLNYRAHIAESVATVVTPPDEPLLFLKPPSAVIASGAPIHYPAGVSRLDPEAEVAIVIGRRTRHASETEALAAIAGVCCFNDVSARNYQARDG